jgi:hypothetical protein
MAGRRTPLRRLAPCVALTVAAHAAVLALPVRPAGTAGALSHTPTMQLRTIEVRPAPPPPIETAVAPTPPAALAEPAPRPRVPVRAEAAAVEQPVVEPVAAVPDTAPVAAVPGWSLPGVADDDDVFLARSFLAVPPAPLAPVIIPLPDGVGTGERYSGELTLYIDETGAVVRVRAESGALPPALEAAARDAFMSVRFRPGELAEHGAVKSRIRIEVVFDGGAPSLLG